MGTATELRRVAERRFSPRTSIWVHSHGWSAQSPDGWLTLMDPGLRDVASFRLPDDALGVHGISPDGGAAVVSARTRVASIRPDGAVLWAFAHAPWGGDSERGSCWYSHDGAHVWAHVPSGSDADVWVVLDAATGLPIDQAPLRCYSAGSSPVWHVDPSIVGLSVGEGQDGCENYWGRLVEGRLVVDRLDDRTQTLVAASPDGRSYLTTPHSDGPVQLHTMTGAVIASLASEPLFGEADGWDFFGGFVGERGVVLTSRATSSLVVADAPDLQQWQMVSPGFERAGEALLVAHRWILTFGWMDGSAVLWEITEGAAGARPDWGQGRP